MTPTEAIEKLGEAKGNAEALRMAKEALGKQVARKPTEDDEKYYHCPVCNNHLIPYDARLCPDCGQALDWEETK